MAQTKVIMSGLDGEFSQVSIWDFAHQTWYEGLKHIRMVVLDAVKLGTVEPESGTAPVYCLVAADQWYDKEVLEAAALAQFQLEVASVTR
jgi:hypothetical protein